MYTVTMEKQCGCFKRSEFSPVQSFESKDDALIQAQEMASDMNETFCQKHNFKVTEAGQDFLVTMVQ